MAGNNNPSVYCNTLEDYQADPRIACKYGTKCYQKNPVHANKYKHPPMASKEGNLIADKSDVLRKGVKRGKKAGANPERTNDDCKDDVPSNEKSPKRSKACEISPRSAKNNDTSTPSSSKNLLSACPVDDSFNAYEHEPEMPRSPCDIRESIRQKFLFEMPEDFFLFWDFCQSINGANPAMAFRDIGLKLVGPYDVLSSHFKVEKSKRKQSLFLLHWRYYFDPPGFQTVLKGDDNKLFHMGYFRDDPKSMPVFIASNCALKDGVFTPVAENIFGAVNAIMNDTKKSATPFLQTKLPKLQKALQLYAQKNNITLECKTESMKRRDRKTVCKTFNKLGLLVPVEKRTEVGYRELIETDASLRSILNRIVGSERQDVKVKALDQLQEVITAANIANDECDFGTSVELGLNLFAVGGPQLDQSALQLLTTGYNLLGHFEFAKVAEVHLKNRRKGANLDMFTTKV